MGRQMIQIRPLTPDELPLCYELGQKFAEEAEVYGGFRSEPFSDIWGWMLTSGIGTVFVAIDQGAVVAGLGGIVVPDPINGVTVGQEVFWYAGPKGRGATAIRLFRAFEEWASERGAEILRFGSRETLAPEGMDRMYRNMGFESIERHYEKRI